MDELRVKLKFKTLYDEVNGKFIKSKYENEEVTFIHSLNTVAMWESETKKSYMSTKKSRDEVLLYLQIMLVRGCHDISKEDLILLDDSIILKIKEYLEDDKSAAVITERISSKKKSTKIITAENIYDNMITLNIPMEFQHWHFNRLLKLIKVVNVKNEKPMTKAEIALYNRELNEKRLKEGN